MEKNPDTSPTAPSELKEGLTAPLCTAEGGVRGKSGKPTKNYERIQQFARSSTGEPPQKRFFRQRAHCNPLSHNDGFKYPSRPAEMDWNAHFACKGASKGPDFADVGCGFGGLLVGLAPVFPDSKMIGMEIREKVCEYVRLRILALRKEHEGKQYGNISVLRTNSMKYLVNFIGKGQLSKIFFCFPDPHFKAKNHRRRIVSPALLDEYVFTLKPNGRLYTITDVADLHGWMTRHCDAHPYLVRLGESELAEDRAVPVVMQDTEEGKKVARNSGEKHLAVYRRVTESEFDQGLWKSRWLSSEDVVGIPSSAGGGSSASAATR